MKFFTNIGLAFVGFVAQLAGAFVLMLAMAVPVVILFAVIQLLVLFLRAVGA